MRSLMTAIKPTGTPHLGNYLGMLRPTLRLARDHLAFCCVADYHALTIGLDPDRLPELGSQAAAVWLALGLDPHRSVLYRQSAVPEVCELAWVLACVMPKGLLNRAHAYKAAQDANRAAGRDADAGVTAGRDADAGVTAGLFNYPVLMAADVLAMRAELVPVGRDQRQHVEILRDAASAFNRRFGPVLTLPEALIDPEVATIQGLDGRKMSKSYGNVIPVLGSPDELRRAVLRLRTDSRPAEEPRDPDGDPIFELYRHVADPAAVAALRRRCETTGIGHAEAKELLLDALESLLRPARERYRDLLADAATLESLLEDGGTRARERAAALLREVRGAVGLPAGSGRAGAPSCP